MYTYISPATMIVESAALYTIPQLIQTVMSFISEENQNDAIPAALADITVVSASSFTTSKRTYCVH
jgi:hypothetical protein